MDSVLKQLDDDELEELIQASRDSLKTLETPNWKEWADLCLANGLCPPPPGATTMLDVAKQYFPRVTPRGFSSMFGCSWQVLQLLYSRYFFQMEWFSIKPISLLWTYNRLSTNLVFDALATIWSTSRSNMFAKVKSTLAALHISLDEVLF